ncbi:hypothetical protein O181_085172 [Austropuccinia psidii MF-1]|uniref:Uncharacterized protein n=1 Tax=Austropuccinia psidii MF-1 TaxID=1389203 RepID=A0A9Q3ILH7_9BASI|nr:hypothetical protein [Austropuccinia psidii MF-1]
MLEHFHPLELWLNFGKGPDQGNLEGVPGAALHSAATQQVTEGRRATRRRSRPTAPPLSITHNPLPGPPRPDPETDISSLLGSSKVLREAESIPHLKKDPSEHDEFVNIVLLIFFMKNSQTPHFFNTVSHKL